MEDKKFRPIPLALFGGIVLQVACAVQMIWGYFGNAWDISWLSSYIGVIVFCELLMYNGVVKSGNHPIKSLYVILIMNGFAFFFCVGFMLGGWSWSWIGLAAAAVAVVVVIPIDKSVSKNYSAEKPEKKGKKK